MIALFFTIILAIPVGIVLSAVAVLVTFEILDKLTRSTDVQADEAHQGNELP